MISDWIRYKVFGELKGNRF